MSTRRSSIRTREILCGALALLIGMPAIAVGQARALSLAEVIDLHDHGVSSRVILRNAREYCIAFSVDDSVRHQLTDRKSTRLNSSHVEISYAVFCLKKKKKQ